MVRADPNSGFWFHGEWIPDPYEWLERFDDPEVMGWIGEQEAATHGLLDAVLEDDFLAVGNRWIEERRRVRSPLGAVVVRAAGLVGENGSGVDLEDLDLRV
ncbi:MAG TPA: hypothetical protein VM450_00705, partial [Thermomicrobiales bacterium]|nr:hypothetical protein [Thermomicrobiales bacterium]